MKQFTLFFRPDEWAVTGFFPYNSCVQDRLLEQNYNYKTNEHDFLEKIWDEMWAKAEELGCKYDNKIVLQITRIPNPKMINNCPVNATLYLGKYDGKVSLGLSLYQDEWLKDRNQYFKL